jgi:hypothetical protein
VKKLELELRGKGDARLKDLEMMGSFQHTGPNEILNSLRIKVGHDYFSTNSKDPYFISNILAHFFKKL